MTFAEKSKYLRAEKNLSQVELANALKVSKACISMLEIGKNEPTANTLIRYADFFECSIDFLLCREDDFGNITIYPQTDNISLLSAEEQKTIDIIRNKQPYRVSEWLEIYATLPTYLQENIFAELKGISLASKTTKKQTKEY